MGPKQLPPLYEEWHEQEQKLPQHDLTLPPPEGRMSRFLFMGGHVHGLGWGNVLQEMVLNAHLAYLTKRSFVFYNYTWDTRESDYSYYNEKTIIPSRVPVSVMLSGPLVGGSFPEHDNHGFPRAVSEAHFRSVCPKSRTRYLNAEEIKSGILNKMEKSYDGIGYLNGWVDYIRSEGIKEERCLEFEPGTGQLFDIWLFGGGHLLSLWPSLRESPVLKQFGFSPLILSAYLANKDRFVQTSQSNYPSFRLNILSGSDYDELEEGDAISLSEAKPIPGLLTLHIRQGDYKDHCVHLSKWSSTFTGFNSFPDIPDKFDVPAGGFSESEEERKEIYAPRCYPSIEDIVKKVRQVSRETKGPVPLRRIFVMSNAPREWLQELKVALMKDVALPWEAIYTSRDLKLTWEQKYIAQAVDMYIATRSQVFVGNGFSSLTGMIMMLRMAHGVDSKNSRLW
ncbi:hypothetical protein K435DRAFT_789854 [Dendrothele bispora CBS 962.96]|uniref:Uncharacterized protein n=1 Tax=Dendrothele bispora (strain CBS 962.96) TaxID=1314807 RepID=A0A4S8MRS2_DENBC|nr:hypothetical protein K435DRAFT_789854 [Dendrothele bispora CBS 962.96]